MKLSNIPPVPFPAGRKSSSNPYCTPRLYIHIYSTFRATINRCQEQCIPLGIKNHGKSVYKSEPASCAGHFVALLLQALFLCRFFQRIFIVASSPSKNRTANCLKIISQEPVYPPPEQHNSRFQHEEHSGQRTKDYHKKQRPAFALGILACTWSNMMHS